MTSVISSTREKKWFSNDTLKTCEGKDPDLVITDRLAQKWKGFGGCFNELGWKTLGLLKEDEKERFFSELFASDGMHFDFCRLPIGANDYSEEWYSLNEAENDFSMAHFSIERDRGKLIPYIKRALRLRPGMKLFASPWSPPTWMKFPKAYNYGTLIWKKEYLEAYALYFCRFVEEYAKEGIQIDQIHVQNEPMSSQKFPSCVWTGEQFRDFIRNYLGPRFKERKIDAEIWLGTLNGPETDNRYAWTRYNDYANIVLDDDMARSYVSGVSYQWAGKYAVQRTRMAWPEIRLIQSENECGDGSNSWDYTRYLFDLFHHYITNGVESYVYWNMILEQGGESTWGWKQNSLFVVDPLERKIQRTPEYYLMKHFAVSVQPGDRRVELEKRWAGNAVAFRNGDRTTVILHNPFMEKKEIILSNQGKNYALIVEPDSFQTIILKK